jgi:hypothetical protein
MQSTYGNRTKGDRKGPHPSPHRPRPYGDEAASHACFQKTLLVKGPLQPARADKSAPTDSTRFPALKCIKLVSIRDTITGAPLWFAFPPDRAMGLGSQTGMACENGGSGA